MDIRFCKKMGKVEKSKKIVTITLAPGCGGWQRKSLIGLIFTPLRPTFVFAEQLEPSRWQGDQIGPLFTHWAIVYFWAVFWKILEVAQNVWANFFQGKCISFNKKRAGLHLGDFFRKLIWSPWSLTIKWRSLKSMQWRHRHVTRPGRDARLTPRHSAIDSWCKYLLDVQHTYVYTSFK
jgi:hypothetical protein